MRKIATCLCHEISDDIGSISFEETKLEDPSPDEVQVELKACSVNFPDLLMIQGKYQFKPPLPFAPGGEAAGDVLKVGGNVKGLKEGDRVVFGSRYGCFSEALNVSASAVRRIPGRLSYAKAASYGTAYQTD